MMYFENTLLVKSQGVQIGILHDDPQSHGFTSKLA